MADKERKSLDRQNYLEGLEREHHEIKVCFLKLAPVIESGRVEDFEGLTEQMASLKDLLVTHVKSEDEVFYRDLREMAVWMEQEALIPALDLFMESMHEVSNLAVEFFADYSGSARIMAETDAFVERLRELRDEVLKRIKSEEGSLFYIYRAYFFD